MAFDPSILTTEQRLSLFEEFPKDKARIVELEGHSTDELASYVADLSVSKPPKEERPRFEIYGWSPMKADHYREWAMRGLIQRIVCMEWHDRLRRRGQPVPGILEVGKIRDFNLPVKNDNPVKPPTDKVSAPVRPGKGPVVAAPPRPVSAPAAEASSEPAAKESPSTPLKPTAQEASAAPPKSAASKESAPKKPAAKPK